MEDRWAKLEEIIRRVVKEELSTWNPQKTKSKIGFKNGFFTGLGDIEMAALESAYPAVKVTEQIKLAAAWIITNPGDAPRSNFGAFLNAWLRKHQNQHSLRLVPTPKTAAVPSLCAYCLSPSQGSVNGYRYCGTRECFEKALGNERPPKMPGVLAAPVTGRD